MISTKETTFQNQDLLTLANYSVNDIKSLISLAQDIKLNKMAYAEKAPLKGKTLGMIFEKPSTRTRVSFEVGMLQLGGHALYLNSHDLQLGRGESIADTAKVLSSYVDAIMIRTFSHKTIEELALHATIPVINGLTDLYHPCQALADLLTIKEVKGQFKGLKLAYIGDGNNVAHSLMIACAKVGIDVLIATPIGFEPNPVVIEMVQEMASKSNSIVTLTNSAEEAVIDADIIYTDVWTSMGQEEESEKRKSLFHSFQVNKTLCSLAKEDFMFLHCLPAHRGEEVTAEIIDGLNSVVFQQAENRLHVQKALLIETLSS